MSGRWQVAQHIYNKRWLVVPPGYDGADSATRLDDYGDAARVFRTHAEALAYADRQARTRKYVLPRPDKDGYIATTDEQVALEGTEIERTVVSVAWIEEPGTIGLTTADSDHYMTTDGAHSIALALLALAEKENNE